MNRRELLQLFGVGGMIAPVIGGTPKLEATAKLIETPKVELASAIPTFPAPIPHRSRFEVLIIDHESPDHRYAMFRGASSVLTHLEIDWSPLQSPGGRVEFLATQQKTRFTIQGYSEPDDHGSIAELYEWTIEKRHPVDLTRNYGLGSVREIPQVR